MCEYVWEKNNSTRWAPASYKWSYNPYKWPYKWLTVLITLVIGVINPVITGRGPTLYLTLQNTKMTTLLASDPSQSSRIDGLNPARI